jgi:hypothetical protein
MKVTVVVCDVCENQDIPARTYQVRRVEDGATANVDLCDEHAEPLEALLGAAPQPKAKVRKSSSKRRGIQPTTLDEIEAQKTKSA